MIRQLERNDLPKLPVLHAAGETLDANKHRRARTVFEQLFPVVFFEHPWRHLKSRSLVSTDNDGTLNGMLGVQPRPMQFGNEAITAAVSAELFVDPNSRTKMGGVQLLKELLNGPHDLSIADIANDSTRKIWTMLGGTILPTFGLYWMRLLRPSGFAASRLPNRTVRRVANGVACLLDRTGQKLKPTMFEVPKARLTGRPLDTTTFLNHFEEFTKHNQLTPIYDQSAFDWFEKRMDFVFWFSGPSKMVAVENARGQIQGWYIYQTDNRGIARVAQVVATPRTIVGVLEHLYHQCYTEGCVAVLGRMQPDFQQAFLDTGCLFRRRDRYVLVHSRRPDIMNAFHAGQAFLSHLEGESCLQVWNDPLRAAKHLKTCQSSKPSVTETHVVSA